MDNATSTELDEYPEIIANKANRKGKAGGIITEGITTTRFIIYSSPQKRIGIELLLYLNKSSQVAALEQRIKVPIHFGRSVVRQ